MTVPRRTRGAGAVVLATVALVLATFAGAAAATTAHPPGNNGTVDIHAVETAPSDRANQPHPGCMFLVAGFDFDANQHLSFTITGHGTVRDLPPPQITATSSPKQSTRDDRFRLRVEQEARQNPSI